MAHLSISALPHTWLYLNTDHGEEIWQNRTLSLPWSTVSFVLFNSAFLDQEICYHVPTFPGMLGLQLLPLLCLLSETVFDLSWDVLIGIQILVVWSLMFVSTQNLAMSWLTPQKKPQQPTNKSISRKKYVLSTQICPEQLFCFWGNFHFSLK